MDDGTPLGMICDFHVSIRFEELLSSGQCAFRAMDERLEFI
jgi:hypothetical protein